MHLTRNITLTLIALVLPHLYRRVQLLRSFEKNAPGKLEAFNVFKSHEIKFQDQVRNCEDVILLDGYDGWALLSCDAGRDYWNTVMGIFTNASHTRGTLYTYNWANPTNPPSPLPLLDFPSSPSSFHPLGLTYHAPTQTLTLINHGLPSPSLSLFTLYYDTPTSSFFATHIRTLIHKNLHTPNALVHLDGDNLLVTNDHFFAVRWHPYLAALETYLALPIGTVVHVHVPTSTVTILARVAFANGIEVLETESGKTVAVASTSAAEVVFFDLDVSVGGQSMVVKLQKKGEVGVPFLPDNLGVDGRALLVTGHGHVRSINAFAHSRAICRSLPDLQQRRIELESRNGREEVEKAEAACAIRSPTFVAQWTEEKGVEVLYASAEFSTGSKAVRDSGRGVGIVSGLFEDGILVWRE